MKLTQLASKPQLIEITIDDQEIKEAYGESLTFYMYDRQPLEKYIKLALIDQKDLTEMISAVKDLILDEDGNIILKDDITLPPNVMTKVVGRVVETLGK